MSPNPYEAPRSGADDPADPDWPPGPGVASILIVLTSVGLLVFVGSHARSDRTNRIPVVTWVGPAARWIVPVSTTAWILSVAGGFLSIHAIERGGRQRAYGALALALALLNVIGNCLFYGLIYET